MGERQRGGSVSVGSAGEREVGEPEPAGSDGGEAEGGSVSVGSAGERGGGARTSRL